MLHKKHWRCALFWEKVYKNERQRKWERERERAENEMYKKYKIVGIKFLYIFQTFFSSTIITANSKT